MAADPEVRFTDDADADAWIYDPREHVVLASRPRARQALGSTEVSDAVIEMLVLADWRESGLGT